MSDLSLGVSVGGGIACTCCKIPGRCANTRATPTYCSQKLKYDRLLAELIQVQRHIAPSEAEPNDKGEYNENDNSDNEEKERNIGRGRCPYIRGCAKRGMKKVLERHYQQRT